MLTKVLSAISNANEPVSLELLSQQLGIEPGALAGMLEYWVRKGRLQDDSAPAAHGDDACVTGSCGSNCVGTENCEFIAKVPKSYSIPIHQVK